MKTSFNKYLYIGFVLFGIYELAFRHSAGDAATYMGIALAFDPFNQEQSWKERPTWQKAILIIHLGIVAGLFGYMIGNTTSDLRRGFNDGWQGK
jgi:H+/Cl- antiporter ClcA